MRYTNIFGNNTLRHNPGSSKSISFFLLQRGGYLRSLGSGLFAMMPMGNRVIDKIKNIIKDELENLGGQEVDLPIVVPLNLWKKTGRDKIIADEMISFSDRQGHEYVLSPSHIESMTQLARTSINSYRDFPRFVYQFKEKFRDEEKDKGGLYRAKEFTMNDAYSFHRSYSDLNNFFPKVFQAYLNIFEKCGVDIISAQSAVGTVSGDRAYEFLKECSWGDNIVISCPECGYKASADIAVGVKKQYTENPRLPKEVATPDCGTRDKLSKFLNIPLEKIGVTELYKTVDGFILVVCRGDYDVSIEKLSRLIGSAVIGLATKDEVEANDLAPGYIFPSNEKTGFPLVVDDSISGSDNLVVGSDRLGYHIKNVNFGIDFESKIVGDIVRIHSDDKCIYCRSSLEEKNTIEIGNIFKIGDFYSKAIGLSFTEENGEISYPYMGTYGIGLGRLLMGIVEANHDDKGIIWPKHLAPYNFFLMGIGKSFRVKNVVEELFEQLGSDVLFDDRHESIGVKFKDFELLGLPYRIVVSAKSLQEGKAEFYERKTGKTWDVPLELVNKTCTSLLEDSE
ncbi:MAG: proline--tRNA ligase [Spirochaetales bacterium]|nr:proline--tRNA ligase [Spirochaetales bacterium]